jgi:hypothetical protein
MRLPFMEALKFDQYVSDGQHSLVGWQRQMEGLKLMDVTMQPIRIPVIASEYSILLTTVGVLFFRSGKNNLVVDDLAT